MKRQLLAAALVLILIVYPSLGITEDVETVMLAKTLYTLCRDESYDTMLAMGTVVMNRVDSPVFSGQYRRCSQSASSICPGEPI